MEKEYREFDFREIAGLDDTAKSLRDWVAKASSFFNDFWERVSDMGVRLSLSRISTMTYENALQGVSRTCYSFSVNMTSDLNAQWWMAPDDLRLIAWEMMGLKVPVQPKPAEEGDTASEGEAAEAGKEEESQTDAQTEEQAASAQEDDDLELTLVEHSVAKICIDEIAAALQKSWMGADVMELAVKTMDRDPIKSRGFRTNDLVAKISLEFECESGTAELNWVSPRQDLVNLLDTILDARSPIQRTPNHPDPAIVSQAEFDVLTVLGNASLPMFDVANLQEGQLIKLDQRIDVPLEVRVNDLPTYHAWPGKRGSKQALEIQSYIEQ